MTMSEASQGRDQLESVLGTSLQAFEDNLSQRTKVPPERIVEFLACSNAELEQQARVIEEVERRFTILLDRCEKEPDNLGPFMRALDPKAFSRDHDWRSLVLALSRQGGGYETYKRVALTKYLEYLSFRKELLNFICSRRKQSGQAGRLAKDVGKALGGPDQRSAASLKQTDAFGMTRVAAMPMASDKYVRLPDKETVRLALRKGESLLLFLASHRFELKAQADELALVDERGVSHYLPAGRSSIGRHIDNDVMLDARYQEISRFHLIIERDEPPTLRLTDISSFGTFVDAARLPRPLVPI